MTPFIPLFCPFHNSRLIRRADTIEPTLICPDNNACIHFRFTSEWDLVIVTFFLAGHNAKGRILASITVRTSGGFTLTVGSIPSKQFSFFLPTFDPLDFAPINEKIKLGLIFS